MWIDYQSSTARDGSEATPTWFQRHHYLSIAVFGATANFACWCILDALNVVYGIRNTDWLLALLPLPPFLIGTLIIPRGARDRWARIVIGTFVAVGLTFLLILFVGVNFHLLIGGSL